MMTREVAVRDMKLIVCAVTKALGSVPQMCHEGYRAAFNPPCGPNGFYIQHVDIGEKL